MKRYGYNGAFEMIPLQAQEPYDWQAVLELVQRSFAFMEGRIDPPSSMHRLTVKAVAQLAKQGEIWVIEDQGKPVACCFLTPRGDHLYFGKMATDTGYRGQGFCRKLVQVAESRARVLGFDRLVLQVRIELEENQAVFAAMGFETVAKTAHAGYVRPTSVTMEKSL